MAKINANIRGFNLEETGEQIEEYFDKINKLRTDLDNSNKDQNENIADLDNRLQEAESDIETLNGDDTTDGSVAKQIKTAVDIEKSNRTAADDAIANGTRQITPNLGDNTQYGNINLGRHSISLHGGEYNGYNSLLDIAQDLNRVQVGNKTITPNLGMETKIDGNVAEYMFKFLKQVGEMGGIPSLPRFFARGGIQMLSESIDLYPEAYSGFSSLAAIAAAIATLNGGDTVDGSVSKKIKDAINAFATVITEDGTINTYKEVLDWIAEHGADFAALVGQVNTNTGRIATLETNMPTPATEAEIREAWNPTPVTPTVTISGEYDSMNSCLTISSTEMAKLEALEPNTEFNLVINATGVDYSGAAKRVTSIEGNYAEPGGYVFVTSAGGSETSIPLWDGEYSYNEYTCVLLSHFDDPDMGEIQAISW